MSNFAREAGCIVSWILHKRRKFFGRINSSLLQVHRNTVAASSAVGWKLIYTPWWNSNANRLSVNRTINEIYQKHRFANPRNAGEQRDSIIHFLTKHLVRNCLVKTVSDEYFPRNFTVSLLKALRQLMDNKMLARKKN